ncbi:hypothetical protein GGI15_002487 [Coemansia interrupta]|uniref:Protein kinase domain-containing protein n=1 Tax=Coemansia interrupta TaxID=1126814 RepID=A0A9W8HFA7_9FUNG|nr:hypothetical protein GGI15_002487 [Coemansia interrupta]
MLLHLLRRALHTTTLESPGHVRLITHTRREQAAGVGFTLAWFRRLPMQQTEDRGPQAFDKMGLRSEMVQAASTMLGEAAEPTEVQTLGVPVLLDGRDALVAAGTGGNKTLACTLPLISALRAVFLGHLVLWAPVCNSEQGAFEMLDMFNEVFRLAMALTECVCFEDINRNHVRILAHQPHLNPGQPTEDLAGSLTNAPSRIAVQYDRNTTDICDGLRGKIPKLVGSSYSINNIKDNVKEHMLFKWFGQIHKHMKAVKHPYLDDQPDCRYEFVNHESRHISGKEAKPNGVVYYGNYIEQNPSSIHVIVEAKVKEYANGPSGEALGQIADYARLVWQHQPTRMFVPVLFLHNVYADLVLFARYGYRYARLGHYISKAEENDDHATMRVLDTIRRLWFFFIQPPERFGHIVDVSREVKYLRFEGNTRSTIILRDTTVSDNTIEIGERIETKVAVHRRTAFLLKVKYRGHAAVLKLAWTPVERQPEGALYDVLKRQRIDCVPEVYRSGIVIPDFLGYRLEFILMEDCGESLYTKFQSDGPIEAKEKSLFTHAENVVRKVCVCLLQAAQVGVVHRDISAGNITLRDGKVFLIDWGFGKVIPAKLNGQIKQQVNAAWGIDLDQITENEDARDGVTGTVLFMGIRLLMNLKKRSIFDDLESVLYAVLAMISHIGAKNFFF